MTTTQAKLSTTKALSTLMPFSKSRTARCPLS